MEETHLGKIEQDAEKRIGVLEKERDNYNVDKNQKMERNLNRTFNLKISIFLH